MNKKHLNILLSIVNLFVFTSCSHQKITEDNCIGTYVRPHISQGKKMVDSLFIRKNKSYEIIRYVENIKQLDHIDTCNFFLPEGVTFKNFAYADSPTHDWDANFERNTWGTISIVWNGENDDYYTKVADK